MEQSRTYNNYTILEYIYTIVPPIGESIKQSVFIKIDTGEIIDPTGLILKLDAGSEDSFRGVCCTLIEECIGWITESESCWTTEDGLSWSV
jgi:predicted RNase H-related nuclease YkuK (DUF458 family)